MRRRLSPPEDMADQAPTLVVAVYMPAMESMAAPEGRKADQMPAPPEAAALVEEQAAPSAGAARYLACST
jgi:hypothetical protein